MVRDVRQAQFKQAVLQRSREVPVVVDFWAPWCGPCRSLGPALEEAVKRREGRVELAKVNIDAAQRLASRYEIKSIPAVAAFIDGEPVTGFAGAVSTNRIERFLDSVDPVGKAERGGLGTRIASRLGLR